MTGRIPRLALLCVLLTAGCLRKEPSLKSMLIWGPETLQAGRTLQLKAAGVYSDGVQRTYGIQWSLSDEGIATIDAKGAITTLKPGVVIVRAEKDGVGAQRPLTVIDVFDGVQIHYKQPPEWGTPNAYVYNEFGARAELYTGQWPGTPMAPEGNGWYVLAVDGLPGAQVIFNDGNRQDPRPLSPGYRVKKGAWWYDGAWRPADPVWEEEGQAAIGDQSR